MDYKVIAEENRIDFLPEHYTKYFDFEQLVYRLMNQWAEDYDGGYYEFREYENGAAMMVLVTEGITEVINAENWYQGEMSWEALSMAANAMALNWLGMYEGYLKVMDVINEHPERGEIWKILD